MTHTITGRGLASRLTLSILLMVLTAALAARPADAKPLGVNGQLLYNRSVPGQGFFESSLLTANPDGSDERLLRSDGQSGRWSPDGTQVATYAVTSDGRITVAVVNADGTGYRKLALPDATFNLGASVWTPDGTRLIVEGWDDQNPARNGLWTIRASDFGDLQRLTTNPLGGHDAPADLSPSGDRILFTRETPDSQHGQRRALFVARSNGSDARQITGWGLRVGFSAGWSPRGDRIVLDTGGTIELVNPDGSRLTPIRIAPANERPYAFNPGWSPDGTRIAFTLCLPAACDIYTAHPDGSDLQQVTHTPDFEEFLDWGTHPPAPSSNS
jgi:Tol biopolymer transport system component